jgi:hypothetical protein
MRVFIGLAEIAGYYRGLREGFEEIGVDASFVDLTQHPFRYGGSDFNVAAEAYKLLHQSHRPIVRRLSRIPRDMLLAWAAARFDVFIFAFGGSFLPEHRDLSILRKLNKRIIFQFHGSDSRPPYIDGAVMSGGRTIADGIRLARAKKEALRRIERYADVLINTPAQGHFHQRSFVNWLRIGLPVRPSHFPAVLPPPRGGAGPLRILHSPSHPEAKGSQEISRVVAKLAAEGLPVQLINIQKQPNSVVLDELDRADLVIDQLYSDYAMPGFATEAAWFGKPVIICGYAKPLWDEVLAPDQRPPTDYGRPEDLERAIRRMVDDTAYRIDLGRRARVFVESRWRPSEVATRYLALMEASPPEHWMYDPARIRYWQGCGLSEDRAKRLVQKFIDQGGVECLHLADKPELERLFVEVSRMD